MCCFCRSSPYNADDRVGVWVETTACILVSADDEVKSDAHTTDKVVLKVCTLEYRRA